MRIYKETTGGVDIMPEFESFPRGAELDDEIIANTGHEKWIRRTRAYYLILTPM